MNIERDQRGPGVCKYSPLATDANGDEDVLVSEPLRRHEVRLRGLQLEARVSVYVRMVILLI